MPNFIPPLQLPNGLAEENIRLKSQSGDAWAALAQNLGKDVQAGVKNYKDSQANKPLTPEQIADVQAGKVPGGLTREQGLSLAERQATARASMGKQIVPVTDSVRQIYKLSGHELGPNDTQVSSREFDAFSKLAQNQQKANLKPPSSYDNMDALIEGVHQFVKSGGQEGTDPASVPGFGKNSMKSEMMSQLGKKYPDDFKGLAAAGRGSKAELAGQTSGARAPNAPQMFKIRAMAESLIPQLDMLNQAAEAVAGGDIKAINNMAGKIGVEFSDKDWSNLKKRALLVADEFQAQIGAGSDSKLDLAKQLLDTADSPKVLSAATEMLREAVKARAIASTGKKPTVSDITGKKGTGSSGSVSAADYVKSLGL